jgi:hypothetical protein
MTSLELLTTLRNLGVMLTPWVDRLRVDAPAGMLTDELRDALRTHKTALLDLVEAFEERVSIAEYGGSLSRAEAERLAGRWVLGDRP